jgi:hypothetical protein
MRTAAKLVYDLFAGATTELELGTPLSAEKWALFRNAIPSTPAEVVCVYGTPAVAIDTAMNPVDAYVSSDYVSIHVRAKSRDEAEMKSVVIRDWLLTQFVPSTESDSVCTVSWQAVRSAGSAFPPRDAKELYTAVQNVQIVRSVERNET